MKLLKKSVITIILAVLSLSLVSCTIGDILGISSPFGPYRRGENEYVYKETINANLEVIINSLQNKDVDKLKSIFSKDALSQAIDFDQRFDYLTKYFEGEIISTSKANITPCFKRSRGNNSVEIDAYYEIETDSDTYGIYFMNLLYHNKIESDIGIHSLYIAKLSEYIDNYVICEGICLPE